MNSSVALFCDDSQHETMLVRHGIMLVGGAGSGKTTCCATLAKSLTQVRRAFILLLNGTSVARVE